MFTDNYIHQITPYKKGYQGMIYLGKGKYGETYSVKKMNKIPEPYIDLYILTDEKLFKTMMNLTLNQYNLATVRGKDVSSRYIIMDFVEGVTLREYAEAEEMTIGMVVHIISEILKALKVLHKEGIVHGDITPYNILMNNGNPILIDYGMTGTVGSPQLGTTFYHEYNCPDKSANLPLDCRSDIYETGMILQELANAVKTLHKDGPISHSKKTLLKIADMAMMPNPDDRYQKVEEMLHTILKMDIPLNKSGNCMNCEEEDMEIYHNESAFPDSDNVVLLNEYSFKEPDE